MDIYIRVLKIMKKLRIFWKNNEYVDVELLDNPVADYYYNAIRRLKHCNLSFGPRENPLDRQIDLQSLLTKLEKLFSKFNITIDTKKIEQNYLNELHDLYFKQYGHDNNGDIWLEIHDTIHLIEDFFNKENKSFIWFDYKENAGPLIKKFDRNFLRYSTKTFKKGMCYFSEHELGKNPLKYWLDGEPYDIENFVRISKPWLLLRPLLDVAFRDGERYKTDQEENFIKWFEPMKDRWLKHYNLNNWNRQELDALIPVGHIPNIDYLIDRFTNTDYPKKIINL